MHKEDCIFCKIVSGEIPSSTIYEDKEFKVFLDVFPASKGHVLIIPKSHSTNIFEIDQKQAGRLFELAVKVAKVLKQELDFEGMNVLQNNGEIAGQTVHHFHVHLIPRYKDDNVNIKWQTLKPTKEELNQLREKLKIQ